MEKIRVDVTTKTYASFRTAQVGGLFDVPLGEEVMATFEVERPPLEDDWKIGMIVGPSGSGKSTLAKELFGDSLYQGYDWDRYRAIVDQLGDHSIRVILEALVMVGFSSPPAWLKPYTVLSNGERFRCDLAKALVDSQGDIVAFDEYTSVVDRNVAKIGSAALAKAMKSGKIQKKFVAVTCHYDVIEWLEPDWVLDMATGTVARRLLRRPAINLEIVRATPALWPLFARHHYLNGGLNPSAACYCALWEKRPVAFCALLPLMGFAGRKRVSRIVVLPDYQGVGIGSAFLGAIGQIVHGDGHRLNITTSHPAMIAHCKRSPKWKTINVRKGDSKEINLTKKYKGAAGRAIVSFEFVR